MAIGNLHRLAVVSGLTVAALVGARIANPPVHAQSGSHPPPIVSMSVLDANGVDTHRTVLAPKTVTSCYDPGSPLLRGPVPAGRCPINALDGMGEISDEMQTIFPPGGLGSNADYLFWEATRTAGTATGAVVLSGGAGPDKDGTWTLRFTHKDRYGKYPSGWGPVFLPVSNGTCLAVPSPLSAMNQDDTFDLNYAAPGTVVADPTKTGRLFMVYEGVNVCASYGTAVNPTFNGYISIGVATSLDYGHSWPVYASANQPKLPGALHTWPGPEAPTGAFGIFVFEGNDWQKTAPHDYGRYPVLSSTLPLPDVMSAAKPIGGDVGDGEPAAFLDDTTGGTPNLYIIHGYKPGRAALGQQPIPDGRSTDLMLARAPITGDGVLSFLKWYQPPTSPGQSTVPGGFTQPGTDLVAGGGGLETPILQDGAYENCGDQLHQGRTMGGIHYVEATKQYLLTFVCDSPSNPAITTYDWSTTCNPANPNCGPGHSWFFATSYDPSDPAQWSLPMPVTGQTQPRQIRGSWSKDDDAATYGGCSGTNIGGFKGLYPSFMSLDHESGHLSTSGYVFYMWGCPGGGEPRQYSSRQFQIFTTDTTPPVTTAAVAGPAGLNGWYIGKTVVSFSATDDMSGVAETESSLDDGATWVVGTSRTLYTDGAHVVAYRSIDVDGNVESKKYVTVPIDSKPPVTTVTTQYFQATAVGPSFLEVRLVAQDDASGIADTEYSIDDGVTWVSGTSLHLGAGSYTLLYFSVDNAGNVERTQSATFTVN